MPLGIPWLADAARLTGYPVVEVPGWPDRGHGPLRAVEGVVLHHTAGAATGDYPSLGVVRDGRPGLSGPLAQLGLGRSGTVFVIAAGVAYHAGASDWAGFTDLNDEFLGIEAESVGTRDDWTPEQRDAYPRLVAALLYFMRRGADRAAGHKEIANPPGRKIDPAYWDLVALRARVARLLEDPSVRIPRTAPRRKAFPEMIERPFERFDGSRPGRIIVPVGTASAIVARAWLSVGADGGCRFQAWFQRSADSDAAPPGAGTPVDWTVRNAQRRWVEIPSGTEFVQYIVTDPRGPGAVTIEMQAK